MTVPFTFHASVANDAISKVTRLFNATLDDVFAEVFQNARRSGARQIIVDRFDAPDLGDVIRIADDGPGLVDPKDLFTLGQSAWTSDIASVEDAAGMGFFALAGRQVRIIAQQKGSDRSWVIDATPDAFGGDAPILCSEGPSQHRGVTVLLVAIPHENHVPAATHAARYLPLKVVVSDTEIERQGFLAEADFIEVWNGIRIGLYPMPVHQFRGHVNVNFHGVTLHAKLPSISQQYHRAYYARLDVTRCSDLKLVLPARKEVVEDAFFGDLRQYIRALMFRRIKLSGSHSLSYELFCEAAGLGVELPPAVMMLRPFSPALADSDNNELKPLKMVDADDVLLDSDGGAIEEQNLAFALSGCRFSETLFELNAAFTGYAWYDAMAYLVVKQYCVIGGDDHTEVVLPGTRSTFTDRPDRLEIHCEIGSSDSTEDWQFETDWLILGEDQDWLDEVDILVTESSKATSADLVDFMERALFCSSDDAEAGSWDQQRDWFHDEAQDLAIALLLTSAEADINAVVRIVERELYWLRRKSGAVTIRIENGHVDVTGLQDESPVAAE